MLIKGKPLFTFGLSQKEINDHRFAQNLLGVKLIMKSLF